MPAKPGRKTSALKSQQNAKRRGFYERVLDEAEQLDFELASDVNGIDDEIALLRVKIKAILGDDPKNIRLIGRRPTLWKDSSALNTKSARNSARD